MPEPLTVKNLFKNFSVENLYQYVGENKNSATIIACSIAVFKGIFRPIFTMQDKKSDTQTKKYTAIREFITEVAAFPLYAITPTIAGKLVDKFSKEQNPLAKDRIKTNAKFLGICLATVTIPAVCNAIQPKIMASYQKHEEAKKKTLATPQQIEKPTTPLNSVPNKQLNTNSGMRVGN